ncbi:transcriptional regulator [Saccharobesus litoralis]|uniref:Transcriptional regulator n=1 Tax=Saccharobesus litoralis TaxID=2172099 RepID=A0A2S0VQB7_9ALTE|nr:AraC family transcriptional regulator [Saccharobesus litoralis]AWB66401.1 transcriptional regulator [Saccharobesus litoralis]
MKRSWFEIDDKILDSHQLAVSLIDLARHRGVEPDRLLRGTRVFYQDLQQSHWLSCDQLFKLIHNAEKLVSSQDLSFLLGRRLLQNPNQPINQVLMNGHTLRDSFRVASCYQMQLLPLVSMQIRQYQSQSYILIDTAISEAAPQQFIAELVATAINTFCKWRLGRQVPLHFYFPFARPRNIYQYEENLGHRLHFNQQLFMVALDSHWLDQALLDNSSIVRRQQRVLCQQRRQQLNMHCGLLQYICQYLQQQPNASLDDCANFMAISHATLKRKLKQHATSFQKLQDKVRKQQAVFDLQVCGHGNEQVAHKLQFNDLPNFRRAIKRWTGMTPSELRNN